MPKLVSSSDLSAEELYVLQRQREDEQARIKRDWRLLYTVYPVLLHRGTGPGERMKTVGYLHCRFAPTGMRWSVNILEGHQKLFARHSVYTGKDGKPISTIYFDTEEESISFLSWALRVWENAVRTSRGDLAFQPATLPKEFFYAVDGEQALLPNQWGNLPWSPTQLSPRAYR